MQVVKLDKRDDLGKPAFKKFLAKQLGKQPIIIFVYAPWCGHCKMMHPEVDKAIAMVKANKGGAVNKASNKTKKQKVVLKVSDEAMSHLTSEHPDHILADILKQAVQGFPTMIKVSSVSATNNISIAVYKGDRTAKDIQEFMSK